MIFIFNHFILKGFFGDLADFVESLNGLQTHITNDNRSSIKKLSTQFLKLVWSFV